MVALVTGGAGFIGSHVVERLISAGMQVKVIDDFSTGRIANISHLGDRVQVIEADIGKHGSWMEEFSDVEYVYHLAALADIVPSIQKPEEYFNANVVGTFNVLNAIRGFGIRKFVYTASSSCYGLCDVFSDKRNVFFGATVSLRVDETIGRRTGYALVFGLWDPFNITAIV